MWRAAQWLQCRLAVLAEHAADDAGMAVSRDAQSYARIEDEQTRAQLLRYYWKHKMEEQRIPLVLWLIDHHPESTLHGHETAGIFPSGPLDRPGGPEIFADASRRWGVQAGEHPQDARVLGNAARALGERSMRDKIDLHKRAQALDPAHWTQSLAQLYSHVLVDSTEIGTTRMALKNPLRDPQLAAQVRNELQTSNDIALIGTVALDVVELAVHAASSSDRRSRDFAVLRMLATELVTHAEILDPQNQRVPDVIGGINGRWSDLMEGVKGLPLASQIP